MTAERSTNFASASRSMSGRSSMAISAAVGGFRSDETSADRNERDAQAWGGSRLDFTCIGPAVNLAARLEKIAAQLGRNVVASSEFARHTDLDWVALGSFAVRGFALPEEIFGLPDDQSTLR